MLFDELDIPLKIYRENDKQKIVTWLEIQSKTSIEIGVFKFNI